MTGPKGNSEFCFPETSIILLYPGWDENEKMRLPFGQAVTWGY